MSPLPHMGGGRKGVQEGGYTGGRGGSKPVAYPSATALEPQAFHPSPGRTYADI